MIKRVSNINNLSGVLSPLFPLIYCDFNCVSRDSDGVFVQLLEDDNITAVMSLKNSTLTIVKNGQTIQGEEIEEFIEFFGITSVISDFPVNKSHYKKTPLLCYKGEKIELVECEIIDNASNLNVYQSVFSLLCENGDFCEWYPSFSKRINTGYAQAVYKKINDDIVSTAVCTALFKHSGVISGVFTLPSQRGKGYAGECVKKLVSHLLENDISDIYLWCEKDKIKFYNNLGFEHCGEIYVREEI